MKLSSIAMTAAAAALLAFAHPTAAEPSKKDSTEPSRIVLFNGEDLTGWKPFLVEESAEEGPVWQVRDGVLVCRGEPLGYLYTTASYKDFSLTLEWRWQGEPGNSGVLLRIAGEAQSFLPRCVEAQLKNGDAGDIWAFYGAALEGSRERFREIEGHESLGDFRGVGKMEAAENPPGEWNTLEITALGENLTVRVNGRVTNEANGLDVVAGPIGLQSEGGEIHFRNIVLEKR